MDQEFDTSDDQLSAAERLKKQRKSLKQRLGLGGKMDSLVKMDDLIDDADLSVTKTDKDMSVKEEGKQAQELLTDIPGRMNAGHT